MSTTPRTQNIHMAGHTQYSSWIEVSKNAICNNIEYFRHLACSQGHRETRLGVVLKGNAYGHGLAQVAEIALPLVDWVYVIDPRDAHYIRALENSMSWPQKDILVLGAVSVDEAYSLANKKIHFTISDISLLEKMAKKPPKHRVGFHLHIDTGLGREGLIRTDWKKALDLIKENQEHLLLSGVLSHFANTEDVTEQTYASEQINKFHQFTQLLESYRLEIPRPIYHMAASAAALILPPSLLDCLRIGISLYGLWPSAETKLSTKIVQGSLPELKAALSWKCPVQLIKNLAEGSYIGYGLTYRCTKEMKIGVLPVGYFDGFPRSLSNQAYVLVKGHRCAVLGRVMMNHIVIDLSGVPLSIQEENLIQPLIATLIGQNDHEHITAEDIARWDDTINYEIVTRLGQHINRIIVP